MTNPTGDELWFQLNPTRRTHLRIPVDEFENDFEFQALGADDMTERRIVLYKVPDDHFMGAGSTITIPFREAADEAHPAVDTDEMLLPFIEEIMREAAREEIREEIRARSGDTEH